MVLNLGLLVYTEFPCLKIFPLHKFRKRDCPFILAHTFVIGLLLLMVGLAYLGYSISNPVAICFTNLAAAAARILLSQVYPRLAGTLPQIARCANEIWEGLANSIIRGLANSIISLTAIIQHHGRRFTN